MGQSIYDKLLFFFAAGFNLTVAAILLLRPEAVLARLGIIEPSAKLLVRSLSSSVAVWGLAYALAAVNPQKFREFVRLGAISKTLFFLIYAASFLSGQIVFKTLIPALIDLFLAGLFVEHLIRTSQKR